MPEVMSFVHKEAAAIRTDLMAIGGRKSAGVLVAIDELEVAQQTTEPTVALQAVKTSLSVLQGISGTRHLHPRLKLLQDRLEAPRSD